MIRIITKKIEFVDFNELKIKKPEALWWAKLRAFVLG